MSSLAFLVTELQSLASETRRKHPEVREAAERSLAILRSAPEQATASLASDGPQSEDLLRPVFMGCATKNAKVVGISLGSLQRLISLKAVPQSAVPVIVTTMTDCVSQGVDIQLRILQTLLSLITNFPQVHGPLLGDALLLCFKLHESRIMVVSSTAAATLRQLVMFVVDKVVDEDKRLDLLQSEDYQEIILPDGSTRSLGPSARDAFAVFEDLCLLANAEKPHFLRLESLPKTFALELIESVVTNYHELFRKHPELLILLQHHLSPLLHKSLSDRPNFPLSLRSTRVVFLLLKQFSIELDTEAEVFFMLLIRIIGNDADLGPQAAEGAATRPLWMRVLAMEIMRGLCSDAELMRGVWDRYDAEESGSSVFTSLVSTLNRLIAEKPALLGVSQQMFGVGALASAVGEGPGTGGGYGLDVGGVAGMVATAATSTMSGVVGMIASGPGLSTQKSAMKLQCIDQLDKADSPTIPEPYIYLLGVQCLVSLSEGFAAFAAPLYTSIMVQKPRAAGDAIIRAPPVLDIATLPPDGPHTRPLQIVRDMVESAWPALLAALSFVIATNLSDELFVDVLASFQSLTNVAGMLGLTTPRDAFFTSLAKFAIPTRIVSSVDAYMEPATPRSSASMAENLGLTAPTQSPGLSERNMACLKVLISSAVFLAGSLGESWFDILEALQNADYVLTLKGSRSSGRLSSVPEAPGVIQRIASSSSVSQQQTPRHPLLTELDAEHLETAIQRLFDTSKNMEDDAFKQFTAALCKLSSEMVGMQSYISSPLLTTPSSDDLSPTPTSRNSIRQRRRVSGIHMPRTPRSGDYAINKLGGVAMLNIHRLIYRSPDVAWNLTISHLLAVICNSMAPQSIRVQAARVLDEILLVVPRNLSNTGDLKAEVQQRVLDALSRQIVLDLSSEMDSNSSSVELRRMGLETLHQILQASGHTLLVGWEKIFEMLASVCKPAMPSRLGTSDVFSTPASPSTPRRPPPLGLGFVNERGYSALVKIAFQSLTLVCDSISSLSSDHLRLCISTIGHFGRQADTNIALTAAESLLWGVSDAIQAKRKDSETEPEYSALWMYLLLEVLGLCTDARPEVRVGAIQTLFRSLQLYGATLSLETWDECLWKVTFPLLESISTSIRQSAFLPTPPEPGAPPPEQAWVESKILALQLIGTIFSDFLSSKIIHLDSFTKGWDVFVEHIKDSVLTESRTVSAPALSCLEKAIVPSLLVKEEPLADRVEYIWMQAWKACEEMGDAVLGDANAQSPLRSGENRPAIQPFSQESLVALVEVIRKTRDASRENSRAEWPLDHLTRLMAILKGILTYPNSLDYRPDVDSPTPLQKVIMEAVSAIDLSGEHVPALVLRDLSDYATLPFLAAFDVPGVGGPSKGTPKLLQGSRKRITYIALTKKTMPLIVDLYLRYHDQLDIYTDGTFEAILTAYAIPIKMKYDCPPPSKLGKDLPLWKTATTSFLKVIRGAIAQVKSLAADISDDRLESIWRQIIDVYRGGILADCSAAENLSLETQEEEENFDLAFLASLEIDITPHLGDPRVSASLVSHLSRVLQEGSKLYDFAMTTSSGASDEDDKTRASSSRRTSETLFYVEDRDYELGTTHLGVVVPRERFSYWCFDLLFLICSDTARDQEVSRRRVAALSISALLSRCRSTLVSYVADAALRGSLPFPRVREEELLYVLRKLLELQLWPGSLWAALSDSPSDYSVEQPGPDPSLSPARLIADAVRRSAKAHLFQLYPILCEIAASPRKTPAAWVASHGTKPSNGEADGAVEELDARTLARQCLNEIGKEMGMEV